MILVNIISVTNKLCLKRSTQHCRRTVSINPLCVSPLTKIQHNNIDVEQHQSLALAISHLQPQTDNFFHFILASKQQNNIINGDPKYSHIYSFEKSTWYGITRAPLRHIILNNQFIWLQKPSKIQANRFVFVIVVALISVLKEQKSHLIFTPYKQL